MVKAIVGFLLGALAMYIFKPLVDAQLQKLFKRNTPK